MKKLFLCLLAITAAISTAWAQTPKKNIFGLRVGMDMSKISILDTGSGEKYLSELRTSFNIGLTDQIRLLNDKPFYFQFGLMLHNKGGKVQATDGGSDIELSLNAMYLELPVMLNYHIRLQALSMKVKSVRGIIMGSCQLDRCTVSQWNQILDNTFAKRSCSNHNSRIIIHDCTGKYLGSAGRIAIDQNCQRNIQLMVIFLWITAVTASIVTFSLDLSILAEIPVSFAIFICSID